MRKIYKNTASKQDIALLYNTSVENIERATKEYEESINPFKKADTGRRQGAIQIAVSVISAVIVLLTLFEMKEGRNATYLPNMSVNGFNLQFIWDKNGIATSDPDVFSEETRVLWDSFVTTNPQGEKANLEIQNSGVGVAKDVFVDWYYDNNLAAFQNTFSGCDDISIDYNNWQVVISIKDTSSKEPLLTVGMLHPNGWNALFSFLPTAFDSSESIRFPQEYLELFKLAYAKGLLDRIPTIRFALMCKDVQGEQYIKEFIIKPEPVLVTLAPDGTGFGSVEFRVIESNTEHHSALSRSGYIAIGVLIGFSAAALSMFIWAICFELHRKKTPLQAKTSMQRDESMGDAIENKASPTLRTADDLPKKNEVP